jgi:hypothetical protein
MAMPQPEFTPNDEPMTDSEIRGRFDHLDELIHQVLGTVQEFATPEAKAMLQRFLSNPAMRWSNRKRT